MIGAHHRPFYNNIIDIVRHNFQSTNRVSNLFAAFRNIGEFVPYTLSELTPQYIKLRICLLQQSTVDDLLEWLARRDLRMTDCFPEKLRQ